MKRSLAFAIGAMVALGTLALFWPSDRSEAPSAPAASTRPGASAPADAPHPGSPGTTPDPTAPIRKQQLVPAGSNFAADPARSARPGPASLLAGRVPLEPEGREGDPNAAPLHAAPPARWKLDREGIQGAIKAAVPEIRECYEAWLELNPNLGGKVVVEFDVVTSDQDAASGKVERVGLTENGLDHAAMEGCVLSVFQELSFEAPTEGKMKVRYPIVLRNVPDAG